MKYVLTNKKKYEIINNKWGILCILHNFSYLFYIKEIRMCKEEENSDLKLIESYVTCGAILTKKGFTATFNELNEKIVFQYNNNEFQIVIRGMFLTVSYSGLWTCKTIDEIFLLYRNASILNYNTTIGKVCIFNSNENTLSMHVYIAVDTILSEFENSFETIMEVIESLSNKFNDYMEKDLVSIKDNNNG